MKSVAIFVAGALLGAFLIVSLSPRTATNGIPGEGVETVEALRAENAVLERRVADLELMNGGIPEAGRDGKIVRNPIARKPLDVGEIVANGKAQEMWRKQNEKMRKNRVRAELERMRGPLELSGDQEKAIGHLISRLSTRNGPFRFGVEPDDALSKAEVDEGIREVLDEDQKSAFDDLRVRDRMNDIEAMANSELADLQQTVNLTDEQKDAAFDVLADFAAQQVDREWGKATTDANDWMEGYTEKTEALSEVLTPEQLQIYRSTPKVISTSFLGDVGSDFEIHGEAVMIESGDPDGDSE